MTSHVITYAHRVSRWRPDARGRLQRAALELFAAQGFAETTVPEITARAGLTTRTFFRHFADKREVLFAGEDELREQFVELIRDAPADLSPFGAILYAVNTAAEADFEPRRDALRRWRAVVASDENLQERGLRKEELIVDAAIGALEERGADPATADIVSRVVMVVFQSAVREWMEPEVAQRPLVDHLGDALARLRAACADDGS